MIPVNEILTADLTVSEQPDRTYYMNINEGRISGYADGIESVQQAIYKILNTERYQNIIYSWNYGTQIEDLYGEPASYVCSELKRRITEALMMDDRIESVDNFEFDTSRKHEIACTFTVYSIYGTIDAERMVDI